VTLKKIGKKAQSQLKGSAGPAAVAPPGSRGPAGPAGSPGATGPAGATVDALFGSGSDGDETLSGASNSLSRDSYYDNLTLEPGATLNANGYRLFVAGTLTMRNGANINRDGLSGMSGCVSAAATHAWRLRSRRLPLGRGRRQQLATQALKGRTLDGELVQGGAGGESPVSSPNGGSGGGVVVVVVSSVPQPAGLTLSANGAVEGAGFAEWLN
jgi:hypothetical protein